MNRPDDTLRENFKEGKFSWKLIGFNSVIDIQIISYGTKSNYVAKNYENESFSCTTLYLWVPRSVCQLKANTQMLILNTDLTNVCNYWLYMDFESFYAL